MDKAPSTQDYLLRALSRVGGNLSGAEAVVEGPSYQPQTQATRETFDLIKTIVAKKSDVVRIVANAILECLKDKFLKDFDKKKEIEDLLDSSLSPEEFDELVNLGKNITDYVDLVGDSLSPLSVEEINELVNIGKKIMQSDDLPEDSLSLEDINKLDNLAKKFTDCNAEDEEDKATMP
ncbi:hypothetical protein KVR01_007425 [Diaporthe batatas]|uniref:uncharacterized protein n=1 Tax=Diaporthe batatas TaxID=748121 RepID=UPI001D059E34|nr:uncharacterized protein KVR01_007425 [Diaporthe batatas]KAG8162947.1 hypothetical protein KVR01_007425 [Diaporthe batatas]